MAKDKLVDYDSTASGNLDVGGISVAEGMLPSNVNNAIREQMSHLKDFADGTEAINALAVDNLKMDGNTISSTDTNGDITLDPNGTGDIVLDANVGIGTALPAHLVDAINTAGSATARFGSTYNIGSNNGTVIIGNGGSGDAMLRFDYEGTNTDRARIGVSSSAQQLEFYTAGDNKRATLDASGNLLVGTTSTSLVTTSTETGAQIYDGGFVAAANDPVAYFNRITSDGSIAQFRKDGTLVGSIGSEGGDALYIGNGDTGIKFSGGGNSIQPFNTSTNSARDAGINLGTSGARFKDLYLSGGVYLGGTGSANLLDDYEFGSWNPSIGGTATYNAANYGRYTKIGNVVTLQFHISIASVGTGSTTSIINLPFTSENIGEVQSGHISYFGNLATATNFLSFYVLSNNTSINFVGNTGNNITIPLNVFAIFGTNTSIYGSITYRTA